VTAAGRPAALPPSGWQPPTRRDGLRVEFVSEDGRQRKWFDFASVTAPHQVRVELAEAFAAATGPLGRWKRAASAKNLWRAARTICRWLAEHRPELDTLAGLRPQDARALALAAVRPSGAQPVSALRALLSYSPAVPAQVVESMARVRAQVRVRARQPYAAEEARRIAVLARAIVRRARVRIAESWQLVAAHRAGRFDGVDERDPRRCLAQALDQCARLGDYRRLPATVSDASTGGIERRGLLRMLHLDAREAWAFAVLLAGLTGYNASMLEELPACHQRGSAPDEPAIVFVRLNKPRRGARSAMTLPLDTLPRAFHPLRGDTRPAHVRDSSLSTAVGVFMLLLQLSEPARRTLGTDRAFVYCVRHPEQVGGPLLRAGLPKALRLDRQRWVQPWLTGDSAQDQTLLGISLDRLRKTHLEQYRRPVAHTPDTLARYLRRMDTVTEEGLQIVKEALDEQVSKAVQRRRMTVSIDTTDADADRMMADGGDTVLGSCADFEHAPLDGGQPCRRSFLYCLDCANARAFPRHLPMQLLVLDELRARQGLVSVQRWAGEYAGRVAQLEDIVNEYEPAQREQARGLITDSHRHLAARLFAGDLDPL